MADWLSGRSPYHLSTNSGTPLVAFQNWRNFKEAFAPELVSEAVEETCAVLGRKIKNSIDPFGGSGTTALTSQFLGVQPTTIEVNPYLADLIEAKLATYDVEELISDYTHLVSAVVDASENYFPGAPDTFVSPGRDGRFIFGRESAGRLAGIRKAIDHVANKMHARLFRVLLCSIAVDLSNVVVSGKGRRYRKGWQNRYVTALDVSSSFDGAFSQAIYDIRRFRNRACLQYNLLRGDSRLLTPTEGEFDLAVFSPPYPNSFDYTDVYNVELWVGGYLRSKESNRLLREQTLRSHVQIKRSYESYDLQSPTLDLIFKQLDQVRSSLWNSSIPEMIRAYFSDMQTIMTSLTSSLVDGGRLYMVVGDSRYQGVYVPVASILVEIAHEIGLKKISEQPFRSMRASPQQGGRQELLESKITLAKT